MQDRTKLFGTELRARRAAAGHSLAAFAKLVHYSKSHLSKVETGAKAPSPDLARRCDSVLECGGQLAGLVPVPAARETAHPQGVTETDAGEVWVLALDDMGTNVFRPVSRRELLAAGGVVGLGAGVAGVPGMSGLGFPAAGRGAASGLGPAEAKEAVAVFRTVFDELRHQGQRLTAHLVVPTLVAQTHALRTLAKAIGGQDRADALTLASRYAEYTGWMVQEQGDDRLAGWWTDRAVEFAEAGGDRDMAAYALVRRGLIALYQHDGRLVVELARQAQAGTGDPRIRGLAAQREAQGLAVTGDHDGCLRALDRAAGLLAQAAAATGAVVATAATSSGGLPGPNRADPATGTNGADGTNRADDVNGANGAAGANSANGAAGRTVSTGSTSQTGATGATDLTSQTDLTNLTSQNPRTGQPNQTGAISRPGQPNQTTPTSSPTSTGPARPPGPAAAPIIGSAHVPDQVAVATGWCLFDLGRPRQAADILQRELARIPADAYRARARFGARLALALAACGEPEQACAVADDVLDTYDRLQSATIRVDLRGLSRDLNRWPSHPAVRRTRLRLADALRT
ncbi:hypothetical protein GCM10009839_75130 [Catenulispora yoronensis]|uniref:HTH cro/C1-type domain-containing protein n=1 Tax=Catenulispora yoronensis TaxID=450799 RepID=A0ABP5GSB5_9ACTN